MSEQNLIDGACMLVALGVMTVLSYIHVTIRDKVRGSRKGATRIS